jgi:hypothetical protein
MQVKDADREVLLQDRRSGGDHLVDAAATGHGLWFRSLKIGAQTDLCKQGRQSRPIQSGASPIGESPMIASVH